MRVFLHTSGIYSFLDGSDRFHQTAVNNMKTLRDENADFISHDYIFVESAALIQKRLGHDALKDFYREIWPMVESIDISSTHRSRAMEFCLGRQSNRISFVDSVSFLILDEWGLKKIFGFDSDFKYEGYTLIG